MPSGAAGLASRGRERGAEKIGRNNPVNTNTRAAGDTMFQVQKQRSPGSPGRTTCQSRCIFPEITAASGGPTQEQFEKDSILWEGSTLGQGSCEEKEAGERN